MGRISLNARLPTELPLVWVQSRRFAHHLRRKWVKRKKKVPHAETSGHWFPSGIKRKFGIWMWHKDSSLLPLMTWVQQQNRLYLILRRPRVSRLWFHSQEWSSRQESWTSTFLFINNNYKKRKEWWHAVEPELGFLSVIRSTVTTDWSSTLLRCPWAKHRIQSTPKKRQGFSDVHKPPLVVQLLKNVH